MGWSCVECGEGFPHGRTLIEHLLTEHPELIPPEPRRASRPSRCCGGTLHTDLDGRTATHG